MVKLSLFLFSIDTLITQQKYGCWLYFHLKNASRMFHSTVVFYAPGLLPWSGCHLCSWGREILLHLGKSRMHGLERKMEARKPLQLPESISLSQKFVWEKYEVGQQLDFGLGQPSPRNKDADDFHHIQMKPEEVFRQEQRDLASNITWTSAYLVTTAGDFSSFWFKTTTVVMPQTAT